MKKVYLIATILLMPILIEAQQIIPDRIGQMPDRPEPYNIRNWSKVAHSYDSLVFDTSLTGEYLPLTVIDESGINYDHPHIGIASYVGQNPQEVAEAINYLPALIGASLNGIDKSDQFGQNWVFMAGDFFNRANGENIYLNQYSGSSGNDWWYETMPNVFFYQLNDLYPETGHFAEQFTKVADRWLEAVKAMGASATPWQVPYMNYRAWDFKQMAPLESGVKQPAASGAIAWILYHAYLETGNKKYLTGAEWALEFLNNREQNPVYELQFAYGTYTAARMNAEAGTNYDVDKMVNWCFNQGSLRGWGIIIGQWGNYECSGLRGEAYDEGNDYAFLMNGIQQAAALVPMVRYQEQYANAIAKWMLNLTNASAYFYPGFLPADHQDNEEWVLANTQDSCIAHESMRESLNGKSPVATGDAVNGGWAPTNLSLYSSSHVGYLGSLVEKTDVKHILRINLTSTDFYSRSFPACLIRNPYQQDTSITIVTDSIVDVYDALENQIILNDVSGETSLSIPAGKARMLVYLPPDAELKQKGTKTFVNNICIDFANDEEINDRPPRIKALKALKNPVEKNDSLYLYCTATDPEGHSLTYSWQRDGNEIQGNSILADKAPDEAANIIYRCVVTANGKSDTAWLELEVLEKIPHIPEIKSIRADPRKMDLGGTTSLVCNVFEKNGDVLSFHWESEHGQLTSDGSTANWQAPEQEGNYALSCTVSDVDGSTTDSLLVMVRRLSDMEMGEPVLLLPFNGDTRDHSQYQQETTAKSITLVADSLGNPQAAASLNGTSSYIRITNDSSLKFSEELTVAGWFYPLQQEYNETYLVSHGSWENRWKISYNPPYLRSTINTTNGILDLDMETPLEKEQWHHFTAVYTGEEMELYLNGRLNTFTAFSGALNPSTLDMTIGKARPDQDYHFHGYLDEIVVYDHALPPSAIKTIYNNEVTSVQNGPLQEPKISIYPQPADKILHISANIPATAPLFYSVITIEGRVIQTGHWKSGEQTLLDTAIFPPGLYLLNLKTEQFSKTYKIIIHHP